MSPRTRSHFIATLLALPFIACASSACAHNGRDLGHAIASEVREVKIFSGITVTTDPRTGVRSYTQTGDIPPNPGIATASPVAESMEHGVDFWVAQSFRNDNGGSYYEAAPSRYADNHDSEYSSLGVGGYLPVWGYGGGNRWGRPGHGNGDGGRPGRPGGGGEQPPPSRFSPPPGPPGGGVGSPPPYTFGGVGSPPPFPDFGVGAPPQEARFSRSHGRGRN